MHPAESKTYHHLQVPGIIFTHSSSEVKLYYRKSLYIEPKLYSSYSTHKLQLLHQMESKHLLICDTLIHNGVHY